MASNESKAYENDEKTEANKYSNVKNVILILGKMLLPDGTPEKDLIERIQISVDLLKSNKLNLNETLFIPSGSDVSNSAYKRHKSYSNAPHMPEATVMRMILNSKHNISNDNIECESQSNNTVENFYYTLEILYNNNITKLNNFFVVTSDFHVNRSKSFFNVLTENNQIFECNNIKFIGVKSDSKQDVYQQEKALTEHFMPFAKECQEMIHKWKKNSK